MAGNSKGKGPKHSLSLAVSAAAAGVPVAQAQEQALEEVVVTATKRTLNLQDIPLSITAIGSDTITRQNLRTFDDYIGQIPSLNVVNRSPGANSLLMRGCAAQGLSFSDSATTSIYLDEQPITAAGVNPDPRLIDIERVEALGGPQGTLYGEAAQCGTLRVITNKPDSTRFSGWAEVLGNTVTDGDSGYEVSGMVNVPLVDDQLALRLVGFYADEAGWIDNVASPSSRETFDNAEFVEDDVNSSTWYGGRASLRWTPADEWTVDASVIYQKYELDGLANIDLNQDEWGDTSIYPSLGSREQIRFETEDFEDEWYQFALTLEGDLTWGNVVFTAAYFDREFTYNADNTTYLQIGFQQTNDFYRAYYNPYISAYDFGGDPRSAAFETEETENWTIEARWSSPADSPSRWGAIAGVFINHTEVQELFTANTTNLAVSDTFFVDDPNNPGYVRYGAFQDISYTAYVYYGFTFPPGTVSYNLFSGFYDVETDQWAVFGELSFDVTENFTITGGARYFDIEQDRLVRQGNLTGVFGGVPDCDVDLCTANNPGGADEDDTVWKFNATYRWDDQLVYATYSEGFRRGGANSAKSNTVFGPPSGQFPPPAGTLFQYDSDTVDNYEIGAKTEWLDNSLRFNITAYYMEWDDIQVQANDPQPLVFSLGIVNFTEAEIKGIETWLNWAPNSSWAFDFTFGWNESELSADEVLFPGTDGELVVEDGTDLPIMPDWKANLTATYYFERELWGGEPYFLANYTYTGESVNSLAGIESTTLNLGVTEQDDWQVLDLVAGLEAETWEAALFIDNVFDEEADVFFDNRWLQQRLSVNQPRTYGFRFRYRFGDTD